MEIEGNLVFRCKELVWALEKSNFINKNSIYVHLKLFFRKLKSLFTSKVHRGLMGKVSQIPNITFYPDRE